jgi:uncharacterized protein
MDAHAPAIPVSHHAAEVRTRFMTRVYLHLLAGIAGFVAVSYVLFATGLATAITLVVLDTNWLLILGGFMIVSWIANSLGVRAMTPGARYGAFALLVVANALLFAAPLTIADARAPGTISTAAWLSIFAFAGLSMIAIRTGKDFSFLRGILLWGGVLALALIVGGVVFGTGLGTWFSVAMIGFAGGAILYETQRVYRSYPPHLEVAAAMSLFASLALLFWYVLQLLTRR